MDTFWIQIIQIKISGKYLDQKNHTFVLMGFLLTPRWHLIVVLSNSRSSRCKYLDVNFEFASLFWVAGKFKSVSKPCIGTTYNMYGLSMDSLQPPDQRMDFWIQIIQFKISGWIKCGWQEITFLRLHLPFNPWLTPDGNFLDSRSSRCKYMDVNFKTWILPPFLGGGENSNLFLEFVFGLHTNLYVVSMDFLRPPD